MYWNIVTFRRMLLYFGGINGKISSIYCSVLCPFKLQTAIPLSYVIVGKPIQFEICVYVVLALNKKEVMVYARFRKKDYKLLLQGSS